MRNFHASFVNKIQRFLTLSRLVSTCTSFPVDYSSKTRSSVQSFDNFKANEIDMDVTNLELARLCGSFAKKILFMEDFGENC